MSDPKSAAELRRGAHEAIRALAASAECSDLVVCARHSGLLLACNAAIDAAVEAARREAVQESASFYKQANETRDAAFRRGALEGLTKAIESLDRVCEDTQFGWAEFRKQRCLIHQIADEYADPPADPETKAPVDAPCSCGPGGHLDGCVNVERR